MDFCGYGDPASPSTGTDGEDTPRKREERVAASIAGTTISRYKIITRRQGSLRPALVSEGFKKSAEEERKK